MGSVKWFVLVPQETFSSYISEYRTPTMPRSKTQINCTLSHIDPGNDIT